MAALYAPPVTTGTAVLDFGTAAGMAGDCSVAVTGQAAITAASHVKAWLGATATADHTVDEHVMAAALVAVGVANIVPGTGFTIYGLVVEDATMAGAFNVHWEWV